MMVDGRGTAVGGFMPLAKFCRPDSRLPARSGPLRLTPKFTPNRPFMGCRNLFDHPVRAPASPSDFAAELVLLSPSAHLILISCFRRS